MKYTANEFSGASSGASGDAGQSGGNWSSRPESETGRAFAVSAPPAGNQPVASQSQYSLSYSLGGPGASAPGANGANRSALGTLIIRPLPAEEGAQAREIVLDGRDVAIGRSPACDVVLEGDQLVSRRHALLRYNGAQYTIVDLGSSNGTYVNDAEIHQTSPLSDGDLIMIGEHEMVYSMRPPSAVTSGGLTPSMGSVGASGPLGMGQEQRATQAPAETAPYPTPGSVSASELFDVAAAQTLLESRAGTQPPARQEPSWAESAPSQAQPMQPTLPPVSPPPAPPQAQPQYQPPMQPLAQPMQPPQTPPQFQPQASQPGGQAEPPNTPLGRAASTTNVRNTSAYLRAVRTQLDEANQRLALAEEEDSRLVEQRRAGMIEVRDRLNAILAEQRGAAGGGSGSAYGASAYGSGTAASPSNPNVSGLVTLARQTEQNPRQIDYMMQLAQRAGEIASALETTQSRPATPGGASSALLAQLEALRARLDELIG